MAGVLGAFSASSAHASTDPTKFTIDFEVGRRTCAGSVSTDRAWVDLRLATFLLLASGILQTQSPRLRTIRVLRDLAFFGFFRRFTKVPTEYLSKGDESSKSDKTTNMQARRKDIGP
jgi:hypothetical protein